MQRRRFRHTLTLEERLAEEAGRLRAQVDLLPPGEARDELVRKARETETASHMTEWLKSPGLQPPSERLRHRNEQADAPLTSMSQQFFLAVIISGILLIVVAITLRVLYL